MLNFKKNSEQLYTDRKYLPGKKGQNFFFLDICEHRIDSMMFLLIAK